MEAVAPAPEARSRKVAFFLAAVAFVVLVAGLTYFGMLAFQIRFGDAATRATAFTEMGRFLSGKMAWYQDARIFGAASLILALISILFGSHPLARITLCVSGGIYVAFLVFGEEIYDVLQRWSEAGIT